MNKKLAEDKPYPLISVVVPVYNVEQYLEECIGSILGQTYPNIEIMLVDDGSTDASSSICDKYASEHDCIKAIHRQNGGLSAARNTGVKASHGDYIGFIDSDDFISPVFYEALYRAIEQSEMKMATMRHGEEFFDGSEPVLGTTWTLRLNIKF